MHLGPKALLSVVLVAPQFRLLAVVFRLFPSLVLLIVLGALQIQLGNPVR